MRRAAAAVLALVIAACADDPARPERPAATDRTPPNEVVRPGDPQRPGNPQVYERIESLDDCVALEDELATHLANAELQEPGDVVRTVSIAYAQAADRRLVELGCR